MITVQASSTFSAGSSNSALFDIGSVSGNTHTLKMEGLVLASGKSTVDAIDSIAGNTLNNFTLDHSIISGGGNVSI